MKQTIITAAALAMLALGTASCGKGDGADAAADTTLNTAQSDSLCEAYGTMAGGYIASELKTYAESSGDGYDNAEFMKGIQAVVGQERSEAYLAGIGTGLRVASDIKMMKELGVKVDRDLLIRAIRRQILADSVNMNAVDVAAGYYQTVMQQQQQKAVERQNARRMEAPEAVQNQKTAEAFIARLKKENPEFKETAEGLGYIITNPGDANHPSTASTVKVDYTGSLLDGKVFDKGEGATFPLAGVVPGFRDAGKMLGVGGEGTFYLPGKLAYGVDGQPQAGIGPNEMLVFKIRLVEIAPESQNQAQVSLRK